MPVFLLQPVTKSTSDPEWAQSKSAQPCRVNADTEDEARRIAARCLGKVSASGAATRSPWTDPALVRASTDPNPPYRIAPGTVVTADGEAHGPGC